MTANEIKTAMSKIKFVRKYNAYRENWYDVIYHCGRCSTYREPELPKTVQQFVENATRRTEQYDRTCPREDKSEIIYEA